MKPVYSPGETLIIEVFGNILEPISPEDVELKRINVQVPWEYDVKRIGSGYYIYGIVPNAENNYTLYINDIATTVNGRVERIDFNQSFATQGEIIPYSVRPGFDIVTEELEFSVFLNRDLPETISIDFPEEQEFVLNPGENTLRFTLSDFYEQQFRIIQIGIYSIPILMLGQEEPEILTLPPLRFFPRNIESTILLGEEVIYPFSIINVGIEEITDLQIEFDPEIFIIEPALIESIGPNITESFNLSLKNQNEPIDEIIMLRSGDFLIEFPVIVGYTEDVTEVETPYLGENYSESQGYYCQELEGIACTAGEICSATTVGSLDVTNCCLGTCSEPDSGGGSLAWIGWLIGVLVVIILVIVGGRYLKTRKQKGNPFKKRVAEAEKNNPMPPPLRKI
jgi:hypothetical protein